MLVATPADPLKWISEYLAAPTVPRVLVLGPPASGRSTLAAAGDQALEAMMTKKFDVVISDLNMPGLTGVELAQKIKEHPVFKATPVFLATSDAYRDQAAVDTVDHFVAKPFSVADMRTAIEAHLGALT